MPCLQARSELAQRLGVKYLEMRNRTEPFPTDLPGRDLYVTFTQDLTPGPEKLLQGLPRDTRYAVRKSQKAGLEWTEDLNVREFYEIYAQSVHRLGTPVFSRELFDESAGRISGADAGCSVCAKERRRSPACSASTFGTRCCRITAGRWRSIIRIPPTTSCTGA